MKYTRKYKRYPTQKEAYFCLEGIKGGEEACTLVNICRKGMDIIFHTDVAIDVRTTIRIRVPVKGSSESIEVTGTLKWLDKMKIDIFGGIE